MAEVTMKRLLAYVSTKDELTQYLASKTLEKGGQDGVSVVVAWSISAEQHTKTWSTSIATTRRQTLKSYCMLLMQPPQEPRV
ncbi:hypothetical protein OS493_028407 [Desmophyllum pertusum]|uniref:Uncharacterized protein n=1 Tax=Desmophyllum pertusum TaxID=174260 RepID=A0A9X0D9K2_9CNID|nr:hypothetical protein OS493_028407 [Desmophyllum pertusum]